jgi:hypothetical protein
MQNNMWAYLIGPIMIHSQNRNPQEASHILVHAASWMRTVCSLLLPDKVQQQRLSSVCGCVA